MVENQKSLFINRKLKKKNEKYVNLITENTYDIFAELGTYGAVLVYFYICSLIPHTYDGKVFVDEKTHQPIVTKPFELSPQAIRNAYGKHSIDMYRDGINRLIELGFIKQIKGNFYQFDDIPLKYRVKTMKEKEEMDNLDAETAFKLMHQEQLKEAKMEELEQPKPREKYSWED